MRGTARFTFFKKTSCKCIFRALSVIREEFSFTAKKQNLGRRNFRSFYQALFLQNHKTFLTVTEHGLMSGIPYTFAYCYPCCCFEFLMEITWCARLSVYPTIREGPPPGNFFSINVCMPQCNGARNLCITQWKYLISSGLWEGAFYSHSVFSFQSVQSCNAHHAHLVRIIGLFS